MSVEADLLANHGLVAADKRLLFAYGYDEAVRERLTRDLNMRLAVAAEHQLTAARFVLWAANEIRLYHTPGHLKWEWLFERLSRPCPQSLGRDLVVRGLAWWGRDVRTSENGNRQYLYSLMAEGGLPEAYLAQAPAYRGALLAMMAEIETEGSLAEAAAERIAWRRAGGLPQTFRHQDTILLFADLALALARLRKHLPADIPPLAAEGWLDQKLSGWRTHLPIRFTNGVLNDLIRPALQAERSEARQTAGPLCRRELRRRADGMGWIAYAIVSSGTMLPAHFLEGVDTSLRLRFLVFGRGEGPPASFLGMPEGNGWRLTRTGAASEVSLPLDPHLPLVLAALADGRPVGEIIADAGLPPPAIAPSFWRAIDSQDALPTRLEPLTGLARTRAARLFLLTDTTTHPVAGEGVTLEAPSAAQGGRLWPVSGSGTIALNEQSFSVITGTDSEAELHNLHLLGRHLAGWRCEDGQIPFVGQPEAWGSEGDIPLKRLVSGKEERPIQGRLGGKLMAWRLGGVVVARAVFVVMPQGTRIGVTELAVGVIECRASGLAIGWHLHLSAGGVTVAAVCSGTDTKLTLCVVGEAPTGIQLRLSDPATGAALVLVTPWPARRGMIVAPDGTRLTRERAMAVGGLGGWRGIAPSGQPGTLLLRSGGTGPEVGIAVSGEVRLIAAEPLARLMLALNGLDAETRLNLIVNGTESPRLALRRYATDASVNNGTFIANGHEWRLHAVPLDAPGPPRCVDKISGRFDLAAWLGDTTALWLIQARAASGSAARPAIWSATPQPFSTRASRIAAYAEDWRHLFSTPTASAWDARWQLIRAVHDGGDAGALDEVQALGKEPAAAIVLLFWVAEADLASVLALEGEAPIWWPTTTTAAWTAAVIRHNAPPVYEMLVSVGVAKLSYKDRYLLTPLSLALLQDVLSAMPGCASATVEVELAPSDRSTRLPCAIYDAYNEDVVRRDVLKRLLPSGQIKLARRKSELPHYRQLSVKLLDGRTMSILFDQGFGAWRTNGEVRHNFAAPPVTQARSIAGLDVPIRTADSRGSPLTIEVR